MAADKASRKINVHKEKLSVCGCRDNCSAIQKPIAYILPCIYIFNMSQNISFTCMQWCVFFCVLSHSLNCVYGHISVILHSRFTGKFPSPLKRGTMTKASIILQCLLCLNVTQWLLCCCAHSHTAHPLAALQRVNAGSYPILNVRESHFWGFLLFHSGILFLWLTFGTVLYNLPQPFSPYWQDVSSNTFINHISSSEFQTMARQIWHWLWQCESGHPSIKWRGCRKSHGTIHLLAF